MLCNAIAAKLRRKRADGNMCMRIALVTKMADGLVVHKWIRGSVRETNTLWVCAPNALWIRCGSPTAMLRACYGCATHENGVRWICHRWAMGRLQILYGIDVPQMRRGCVTRGCAMHMLTVRRNVIWICDACAEDMLHVC